MDMDVFEIEQGKCSVCGLEGDLTEIQNHFEEHISRDLTGELDEESTSFIFSFIL